MKLKKHYIKGLISLGFLILPNLATSSFFLKNADLTIKEELFETRDLKIINKAELYKHIAVKESHNRYNVSNRLNMLGKYQASKTALLDFGYPEHLIDSIRSTIYQDTLESGRVAYYFDTTVFSHAEQERFIRWFINKVEKVYLKEAIEDYSGKVIDGVYVTKAGILYASMLGFKHVKNFLNTNGKVNFSDSNGTSIKERLLEFEATELHACLCAN